MHPKEILVTLLWGLFALTVQAQCPDFTDLSGPGVTCYYGTTSNPNAQTGIVPDRHTVITEQATGTPANFPKTQPLRVRAVRSFPPPHNVYDTVYLEQTAHQSDQRLLLSS